VLRITKLLPLS